MGDTKVLEKELNCYALLRDDILKHHEGKFALIIGEELLGAFDTTQAAYDFGIRERGNVPMLIKHVTKEDEIVTIPALTFGLLNANF